METVLKENSLIQVKDIFKAHQNGKDVVIHNTLQRNDRLSE
ncbi:threonine dehydratase, partial [Bacillus subtilis]|nr:threonine dehydratase [Bacillus subtilis]